MVNQPSLNTTHKWQAVSKPRTLGTAFGILFLLSIALLGPSACRKPNFSPAGQPVDTPVIYGVLMPEDSVQSLMVFRSVLHDAQAGYAPHPDSLFPPDWRITLIAEGRRLSAIRETLEVPLWNLPFRIVYRIHRTLPYGAQVRLELTNEQEKLLAWAEIALPGQIRVIYPSEIDTITPLSFYPGEPLHFQWYKTANVNQYALQAIVAYSEWTGSQWNDTQVVLHLASGFQPPTSGGTYLYTLEAEALYQTLRSALLTSSTPNTTRRIRGIQFIVWGSTPELRYYRQSYQAQAYSLVSGEVLPMWTNIHGGIGVLAARTHRRLGPYRLTARSIDSLACHRLTRELGFQPATSSQCP